MRAVERKHRLRCRVLTALLIATLIAGAVGLQYSLDSSVERSPGARSSSPYEVGRSVLDVLGGIRESLAAYFWTKTDEVFHVYMGGDFMSEEPLYPYYWMVTRLDPHFTMAYYFASWVLCRMGKVQEGFDLALEGLRYNPTSAVLQENLAALYLFFKKDPRRARYHALKAIQLSKDPDEIEPYMKFLSIIDLIISGERTIPEMAPMDVVNRIGQEAEHEEGHGH